MKRVVVLRRAARHELDASADWYEQRRAGLGARFMAAVQEVFDTASADPHHHPRVFGDVREGLVHGFPYCVYYREETGRIVVIAIFHTSRDPSIWQSRT